MIDVREIRAEDEAAWRRLWRGYLDFYDDRAAGAGLCNVFRPADRPGGRDYYGILAVEGEEPIGLAHYIYHRHGWQIEDVCYLQDLYVAPEARGSGAGRALIEAVYAAADAAGRPNVYWLTQEFNATARRLYDQLGSVTPFIKYRR